MQKTSRPNHILPPQQVLFKWNFCKSFSDFSHIQPEVAECGHSLKTILPHFKDNLYCFEKTPHFRIRIVGGRPSSDETAPLERPPLRATAIAERERADTGPMRNTIYGSYQIYDAILNGEFLHKTMDLIRLLKAPPIPQSVPNAPGHGPCDFAITNEKHRCAPPLSGLALP